jgi:3-oxoacyl-[acyl-carrier protein] reductase
MSSLNPEVTARTLAAIPVGRRGEPHEVAAAISYLASDEAGFVTGAIIDITGGSFIP